VKWENLHYLTVFKYKWGEAEGAILRGHRAHEWLSITSEKN